ncbi:AMP-binding protein, partial [Elioraea sp.]|uniref:AMP-binding protein n=1 Tax=Elioraea sp. TaxID=2185103 RepID=UPI003F7233B9
MDGAEGFLPLFRAHARAEPAAVFARIDGAALSFGALDRMSDGLAAGLAGRGVAAGGRVAAMLRNGRLPLVLLLAIAKLGAVWVPVNAEARGAGLGFVLEHAEPSLVLAEAAFLPVIAESGAPLAGVPVLPADGDEVTRWLDGAAMLAPHAPEPDAPFGILYTSGTTGRPKGVIVTHRMMRLAGEAAVLVSGVGDGDVMLVWEPLYHIGGAQLIVVPLLRRAVLALVPRFNAHPEWAHAPQNAPTPIQKLRGQL